MHAELTGSAEFDTIDESRLPPRGKPGPFVRRWLSASSDGSPHSGGRLPRPTFRRDARQAARNTEWSPRDAAGQGYPPSNVSTRRAQQGAKHVKFRRRRAIRTEICPLEGDEQAGRLARARRKWTSPRTTRLPAGPTGIGRSPIATHRLRLVRRQAEQVATLLAKGAGPDARTLRTLSPCTTLHRTTPDPSTTRNLRSVMVIRRRPGSKQRQLSTTSSMLRADEPDRA